MVIDRRERPSHGYRAMHVVVQQQGKPVEIQVRTRLQHLWAELSEKLSDVEDPSIKYGGGDEQFRAPLLQMSALVAQVERREQDLDETPFSSALALAGVGGPDYAAGAAEMEKAQAELQSDKVSLIRVLELAILLVESRGRDALPH
jgi:hypothetical protein